MSQAENQRFEKADALRSPSYCFCLVLGTRRCRRASIIPWMIAITLSRHTEIELTWNSQFRAWPREQLGTTLRCNLQEEFCLGCGSADAEQNTPIQLGAELATTAWHAPFR